MAEIEVREIRTGDYREWDTLASGSPQGTVFHRSDWMASAATLLRKRPLLLGCFADGSLAGGCSLYVTRDAGPFLSCSATAPTTPFGGFFLRENAGSKVRESETERRTIVRALTDEIAGRGFMHVNIVSAPAFHDIRPLTLNDWTSRVYYTYFLPLSGDLFSNVSKKARNTIRKGDRNGIRVRRSCDPAVFWDLVEDTYRKQNRPPPYSRSFLTGMLEMIEERDLGETWVAETPSGEPVAAEAILRDGRMAHRWAAASDDLHRSSGASSVLLFEVLQDLQERGFAVVNLMAGNIPRLSRFVSGFNPDLVPYYGVERSRAPYGAIRSSKRWLSRLRKGRSS